LVKEKQGDIGEDLIDFYDFLCNLKKNIGNPSDNLSTCIRNIESLLNSTVLIERHQIRHPHAHGVTIFFPYSLREPHTWYMEEYTSYNLTFVNDTHWGDFLKIYLYD